MGNGGSGKQVYPPVDPGGLQTASTGATALGFVALVGSGAGAGPTVASALGLGAHTTQFVSAGISMASLGSLNLFSAGLLLVGVGIVLNIASLVRRRGYQEDSYSRTPTTTGTDQTN